MPHARPLTERQRWVRERQEELPAQLLAGFTADLIATAPTNKVPLEMGEWQIRRVRRRMAELDRRLAQEASRPRLPVVL